MYNIFTTNTWRYAYANIIPRLLCAVSLYSGQMPHHLLPGMENFCRRQYAKALGSLKSARGFETLYLRSGRSTHDRFKQPPCLSVSRKKQALAVLFSNTERMRFPKRARFFPRETHSFADHEEASLMPCCPAVIDLWAAQDATPLTFPHPNIDSIPFFIRSAIIDAILQQTDRLPEQILSACFLYDTGNPPKKKSRQKTFFQIVFLKKAFCQLYDAMDDLSPDCIDSVLECNELFIRSFCQLSERAALSGMAYPTYAAGGNVVGIAHGTGRRAPDAMAGIPYCLRAIRASDAQLPCKRGLFRAAFL